MCPRTASRNYEAYTRRHEEEEYTCSIHHTSDRRQYIVDLYHRCKATASFLEIACCIHQMCSKWAPNRAFVRCLDDGTEEQDAITPIVEVVMLDGPDIMYMLKNAAARNFPEYAQDVFLPYVERQLCKYVCFDVASLVKDIESLHMPINLQNYNHRRHNC